MSTKPTQDPQIPLFIKSYTIKASSLFILFSLIVGVPSQANAGFFGDLITSVMGQKTQAEETISKESKNVQNVPILDTSSIDPDVRNTSSNTDVNIVEGEALLPSDTQGTEAEVNSYFSSSESITTYKVKEGDTVGKIAAQFGISKNTILYANTDIKNNALKVGQTIIILPVDGVSYTVKKGDTMESIAKAHKADAKDIEEFNNISGSKGLKAGQVLIVPGGVAVKKAEEPKKIAEKTTTKKTEEVTNTEPKEIVENKPDKKEASPEEISSGNGITGDYIWPFPKGVGRVSQKLHDDNAYDFAAPKGTPIYAIQDGTVLIADGSGYNGGYGLYVVVNFDDGGQAIFGHMSKVVAQAGDVVSKGDIIGYVGSTGRSTGNHVHIGYRGGKANPYRNLPKNSIGL